MQKIKTYPRNILTFILILSVILGIDFFGAKLFFAQAQTTTYVNWTQLQGDAQKTGRSTAKVDPNYGSAWTWIDKTHIVKNFTSTPFKSINDNFEAGFKSTIVFSGMMQPVVANGRTFFGAMNGTMYAVDSVTGDNRWDYTSGGPILNTAGYTNGVIIFGSMDGNIYGLNETDGSLKWTFTTKSGVMTAPAIVGNNVYLGSRDGSFYAINAVTGAQIWKYSTRDVGGNSAFNNAPIVGSAAVSEDGSTIFFGAENMNFYALNATNGTEKWTPKKVVGQSFLYTWPTVKGNLVITRTMSSLQGSEYTMETQLDGLSANTDWTTQKNVILNWLATNPEQKIMYTFDVNNGYEPYQVAMGRVTGNNFPPHSTVVDNSNRILSYWRVRDASFISSASNACFGTKYCPDISAMDPATGDRVKLTNNSSLKIAPELDNGFQLTVGGNLLYFHNHFRGTAVVNLDTGALTWMTRPRAVWDCGNERARGFQIIYYGDDGVSTSVCNPQPPDPIPDRIYNAADGFSGVAIGANNGTGMLYINERDINGITGVKHI